MGTAAGYCGWTTSCWLWQQVTLSCPLASYVCSGHLAEHHGLKVLQGSVSGPPPTPKHVCKAGGAAGMTRCWIPGVLEFSSNRGAATAWSTAAPGGLDGGGFPWLEH